MALNPIGMYDWGPGGIDEDVSGVTNYGNSPAASINYTSCENSARIIATGNKSVYPAAWAAHEYSTEGTAPGDWCLPAAGILTNIYNNQSQINAGFSRAGGSQFTYDTEAWSSSEGNPSTKAWYSNFTESYGIDDDYKYAGLKEVRPIIEF